MNASIDVIIPTYGRPKRAEKLTVSIVPQLSAADRIVVVWQGDARPDIRETRNLSLLHSRPPSLPKARNAGIRSGKSIIVLFLDDDVTVAPGLLDGHRKAYDDPAVGAVAGRIDDPIFDGKEDFPASFDETTGWAVWYCHSAMVSHHHDTGGGCRAETALAYCFHQFANTAYFAARHCRKDHWKSWFTYWKYRLEHESRKKTLWLRHDPRMVAAGMVRHMIRGRT